MVSRSRAGLSTIKNRLLVAMSVFDIIGSVAWALSTTPIPRGSPCTYGAIGSTATCSIQGFMITIWATVPTYNAMLCIYFLQVIQNNVSDEILEGYERLMHLVAILPSTLTAVVAASSGLFNNYSCLCWLAAKDRYTKNHEEGLEPDNPTVLNFIFMIAYASTVLVLFIIVYCMRGIYKFVRERESRMNQYSFRPIQARNPSNAGNTNRRSTLTDVVHDTFVQANLYVISFLSSFGFMIVLHICEAFFTISAPYPLMIVQGFLIPLQGCWNFLIYIRPRFKEVSRRNVNKAFLWKLYFTIFYKPGANNHNSYTTRNRGSNGISRTRLVTSVNPRPTPTLISGSGDQGRRPREIEMVQGEEHLDLDEQSSQHHDLTAEKNDQVVDSTHQCSTNEFENYRKEITLSLLLTEDILPPRLLNLSPRRHGRRRRSITSFPFRTKEDLSKDKQQSIDDNVDDEEANINVDTVFRINHKKPAVHGRYRRHSCPTLTPGMDGSNLDDCT